MPKVLYPGYFPFCYGAEIRGEGLFPDLYPENWTAILTSLGSSMALYWRLRSYTVSGEIYNPFDPPEQSLQKPFSVTYTSTASSEKDLVCYHGFAKTSESPNPDDPEGFDSMVFEMFPDWLVPSEIAAPIYGADPLFGVYLNAVIANSADESSSWTSYDTGASGTRTSINFTAFAETIPVYLFSNPRVVTGLPVGTNSISITGTSYWSYDGTYDTATGAPL